MKKILLLIILSLFALNTSSWAQSDTLPNNLGKKVITHEGLKNIINSNDTSTYLRKPAIERFKGTALTRVFFHSKGAASSL